MVLTTVTPNKMIDITNAFCYIVGVGKGDDMTIRVTRHGPGNYTVTDGVNECEVYTADFGYGDEWIAACAVNNSDPVSTYRDARAAAVYMLENWNELRAI